jgi:hypothetical protein
MALPNTPAANAYSDAAAAWRRAGRPTDGPVYARYRRATNAWRRTREARLASQGRGVSYLEVDWSVPWAQYVADPQIGRWPFPERQSA